LCRAQVCEAWADRASGDELLAIAKPFFPSGKLSGQDPAPVLKTRARIRIACQVVTFLRIGVEVEELFDARPAVPHVLYMPVRDPLQ
jgi:hypothetical protein